MRRMKKRGPNVLYDLNDLLFFLTHGIFDVGSIIMFQPEVELGRSD